MLTIIMYHYVRDLPHTRYPQIKGLLTSRFKGQLDYIARHYTPCTLARVVAALRGRDALPENACLLTFDDGFIDHYVTVFPRLEERGISGSFYPPTKAVEERKVIDPHKIHFVLASSGDAGKLVQEIMDALGKHRNEHAIPSNEQLYETYAVPDRYDPPQVSFVKGFLQKGRPETIRLELLDRLFALHVSADETGFAGELYMDITQLSCMARHGMEIGGHGHRHVWMETLSEGEQREEVRRSVDMLTAVYGRKPQDWSMSYPYGSYNTVTISLLKQAGCALALTTKVSLVRSLSKPYELSRLDTNDLPITGDAPISTWTNQA